MKTNTHFKNLISILILSVCLSGCAYTPPLYYPNAVNAPLFSNKGDVIINGSLSDPGGNVQLAVATTEKAGLILNADFGDMDGSQTVTYNGHTTYSDFSHNHTFVEGGYGIYQKLGRFGRAEAFGLFGYGASTSTGTRGNTNTGKYFRYAIQGDFGFLSKPFEGILSCRAGYLDLNAKYSPLFYESTERITSSFFFDPAFTLRLGYNGFKIFTQLGFTFPFNSSVSDWEGGWIAFGIQARIAD